MHKTKITLTLITIIWLLGLVILQGARDVLAHDYLHYLPVETMEKLPLSTRTVAIPILAATSITGISYMPFLIFWGFIFVWPLFIIILLWMRAKSEEEVLSMWVQGVSLYGIIIFMSVMLISFSLWLPFRYS